MKVNKTQTINISYTSGKTIEDLCEEIKKQYLAANITGDITNISLEHETEYDSTRVVLEVSVCRDETPQEEKVRLAREEQQLNWKRKQYEALKKEFGA